MKKLFIIIILLFCGVLFFPGCSCNETPESPIINSIKWSVNLGGTGTDDGYSVLQSSDGHYIIAGSKTESGLGKQCYIAKLNKDTGVPFWERTFGGSDDDEIKKIVALPDGFAFFGTTKIGGLSRFYIGRTDSSGMTNWTLDFGNNSLANDAHDMIFDGTDLVVIGNTNQACVVAKISLSTKNVSWQKSYFTNNGMLGFGICKTHDNNYAITGRVDLTNATLSGQGFVMKLNTAGDRLWFNMWGGLNPDAGNSIRLTSDNGFVIAGYSEVVTPNQGYLRKTDQNGNLISEKYFGENSGIDKFNYGIQTADGGYIAIGTSSYPSPGGVYICKIDSSLSQQWYKSFGVTTSDQGYEIIQVSDYGYVLVGYVNNAGNQDIIVKKLDPVGNN